MFILNNLKTTEFEQFIKTRISLSALPRLFIVRQGNLILLKMEN